jgi:hypothetical protein
MLLDVLFALGGIAVKEAGLDDVIKTQTRGCSAQGPRSVAGLDAPRPVHELPGHPVRVTPVLRCPLLEPFHGYRVHICAAPKQVHGTSGTTLGRAQEIL